MSSAVSLGVSSTRPSSTRTFRRWAPWLLVVAVALAALIVGAHRSGARPSLEARVMHIAGEVRCPVCEGQSAAQSQSAAALQIRNQIRQELVAGQSEGQILAGIVGAYGTGILEKPQAKGVGLVVWVVPVLAVVAAGTGLGLAFRRWHARSAAPVSSTVAPSPGTTSVLLPAAGVASAVDGRGASAHRTWRRPVVIAAGVALIAAGASWAVVASSTTRLPGQPISGQTLGSQVIAQRLAQARQAAAKGDAVTAIKDYQAILKADPNQPDALAEEGWLLVQTQQPALLRQGLDLLSRAERAAPSYSAAHFYRGIGLLTEDDYTDAVPELKWYMSHDPDPRLVNTVRQALKRAEAGAASQPPAAAPG